MMYLLVCLGNERGFGNETLGNCRVGESPVCQLVNLLTSEPREVFDLYAPGREAARGLKLCQAGRRVADYSFEFWTVAVERKWSQRALYDACYHGPADYAKESAGLMLEHVLCLHSLPRDLVSDWGPQCTSTI